MPQIYENGHGQQHSHAFSEKSEMGRSMAPPAFQLLGGASAAPNSPPDPGNPIQRDVNVFRDNSLSGANDFAHEFPKRDSKNKKDRPGKDKTKTKAADTSVADPAVTHDKETETVKEFALLLDQKVDLAYKYVLANPHLGKFQNFDCSKIKNVV